MAYTDNCFEQDQEEEATDDYSSFWQSIPDPPAPQNNTTSDSATAPCSSAVGQQNPIATTAIAEGGTRQRGRHRNRKRDSFAFRDVTNNQQALNRDSNNDSSKSSSESIPSALEGDDSTVAVDEAVIRAQVSEEVDVEKKRKRRKKRRSMLLPSDDESGTKHPHPLACFGHGLGNDISSKIDAKQRRNTATDSVPLQNSNTKEEALIQLVRDYCSLPMECQVNSKESDEIESLSGYPMPGKILPVMGSSTSKKDFLLRVQPIVQEMENMKQRDVADTKLATQCEVKKNGRGGYCYYDINSGGRIHADEYNLRYTGMIQRQKRKKNNRDKECSKQGSPNSFGSLKINSFHANLESNRYEASPKNEQESCDDSNMDESVNMDESMSPADSVATCEDGKQSVSIRTATDDLIIKPDALDDSLVSEGLPSNDTHDSQTQSEGVAHENNRESHPLLDGLPASNDPRILAARRKLWRAMDDALAVYSQEILAIEEAVSGDSNS